MLLSGYGHVFLIIFFCLICDSNALKCRTAEESQTNEDFEYVVRMCLRQMKNASRSESFERNIQNMFDQDKMRNDMNSRNKNYNNNNNKNNNNNNNFNNNNNNNNNNNRNQGDGDGFEYFWSPNSGRDRDKDREQNDRGKMDNDYMEDSDYFHGNPFRGMNDNRARGRRPHTYQQQIQHDRDSMYGYGHRDSPFSYQKTERNKKRTSNREQKGDSPLEQLDPCMIHCIFQEMQMLDDNGKPDRNIVSEKMSQKIRNPELKSFIQDSVEECFEMIEEEPINVRNRGTDTLCLWAKNFAVCLEDKGKESCDDWNDPIHRNSNKNRDEQKNKNTKGGNNKG